MASKLASGDVVGANEAASIEDVTPAVFAMAIISGSDVFAPSFEAIV